MGKNANKNAPCATWKDQQQLHTFIMCMLAETERGNYTDNSGYKKDGWNRILTAFNAIYPALGYDKNQLQNKYSSLKKEYTQVAALLGNSGFGKDPITGMPTAPPDVWDRYLAAHPDSKVWQTKKLAFYEELDCIFSGNIATGVYAKSSIDWNLATSSAVGDLDQPLHGPLWIWYPCCAESDRKQSPWNCPSRHAGVS